MADVLTIEIIKTWLQANKDMNDVKQFLQDLNSEKPLNVEIISKYLETQEGQIILQPIMQSYADKRVTEAVKTRDKYHEDRYAAEVGRRVAAEMIKINPQETPEQKRIREIEAKLEESNKARETEAKNRRIAELGHKYSIEPDFLEGIPFESAEMAELYMQRHAKRDETLKNKWTNELMVGTSMRPGSGIGNDKVKVDLSKLSQAEIIDLEMKGKLDGLIKAR